MKSFRFYLLLLLIIVLFGCNQKKGKSEWKINNLEYLETPGFNVLVFHDRNPEFGQGGIEFIHHFAHQAEYVIGGAASYIFCILAADKMLNE